MSRWKHSGLRPWRCASAQATSMETSRRWSAGKSCEDLAQPGVRKESEDVASKFAKMSS